METVIDKVIIDILLIELLHQLAFHEFFSEHKKCWEAFCRQCYRTFCEENIIPF